MDVFSVNGQIKPKSEATASLFDVAFTYGFGVYENIRVVKGIALYADEHCVRLQQSAEAIGLKHDWSAQQIEGFIADLVAQIEQPAINIKMLLIGGPTADDAKLYILPLAPRFVDRSLYKKGAHAITIEYERFLPQAKTLNMLPSYLAYREAQTADAYDAIFVDRHGNMVEGSRTNLFAIKDKTLFTPPKEQVLEGVTKTHVIACAKDNNFEVKESDLPLDGLTAFDSFFLTSTSSKIMPLKSIDDANLTISEPLRELMKHFKELY